MLSGTWIRSIILAAAILWAAIAVFSGESLTWSMTRPLGIVIAAVTGGVVVFEKWAWRWPLIHRAHGTPVMNGTWKADQYTSWAALKPESIKCYLVIRQTFTTVRVRTLYEKSASPSIACTLAKRDGVWKLSYTFVTFKRTLTAEGNPTQRGAADLVVSTDPKLHIQGDYWMEFGTRGEIQAHAVTRRHVDTFEAANQIDF